MAETLHNVGAIYRRLGDYDRALSSLLRSVQTVGEHLVVVRCEPGAASAVARALDSEKVQGMVGTVAGDDTVFLAVVSGEVGNEICERVHSLL